MTKTEFILLGKRLASLVTNFGTRLDSFIYSIPSMITFFDDNPEIELNIRTFLQKCNNKYNCIRPYGNGSFEISVEALTAILDDMRKVYRERYCNAD